MGGMERDYGCGLSRYLADIPCCCPLCLEADRRSERMRAMKALLKELGWERRGKRVRRSLTKASSVGYNCKSGG